MWRTRAILSLLVESVAALRCEVPQPGDDETDETTLRQSTESSLNALKRAKRRAALAVTVDWVAIALLFLFRPDGEPFLTLGADPRTVFTAGILAVAVHSGFRLGQLEKYRAVERACRELSEREAG